ncbi:Crp/Fnr family transcriptional regulator [Chitinophaga sp. S165]|uniref:Crp/Fnr family transcriptional regulator n=1 Tax=Chitinophaga sp. S165 TaxID=2135462 RepID=UPI000D718838|nr:Crp/Fnr family transcriptional regulator [Chitinophaga sp. S165]PWV56882.1 CRP-like cAMP-binding protein [Chitinophaga sp. S165]
MMDQFETILSHFRQYIKVSEELEQDLRSKLVYKASHKGDIIQYAEKVCTKSYFIIKGLTRTYYLKDGVEISEYFSCESEWVNSPKSFIERTTDIYSIDCLENTEAFCIDVNDLVYLFNDYPEMERYARLSMGSVFGHLMERITSLRFTSAKEKYDHFIKVYHDIHHRIPLGMVASYLGITQSTLSRLRAGK